jgi:hypothetical protein
MRSGGCLHWLDLHHCYRIPSHPTVLASSSQLAECFSIVIVCTNPGGISSPYMVGRMPSRWNCDYQTTPPTSFLQGNQKLALLLTSGCSCILLAHEHRQSLSSSSCDIHLGRKTLGPGPVRLQTLGPSLSTAASLPHHAPCIFRNPSACSQQIPPSFKHGSGDGVGEWQISKAPCRHSRLPP